MGNMSYCRFENTLSDLKDCYEALGEDPSDLSSGIEKRSRENLLLLCKRIADEGEDEIQEIESRREKEREARLAARKTA